MSNAPRAELAAWMAQEHLVQVPREALALAEEIRRRHHGAVTGVFFYGSCLRRAYVDGGVLDFYAVVDSYKAAYGSRRLLRISNSLLPPNTYYVELPFEGTTLRMKYNILSQADFSAACRPECPHPIVWARFCQPAALLLARDEATRGLLAEDCAEAAVTMVGRMLALHPEVTTTEDLWQAAFATTYTTELRVESPETIRSVYAAVPDRYDKVAELAVAVLAERGLVEGRVEGASLQARMTAAASQAVVADWKRKLPIAKALYMVRLIKSAFTFGEWLPYALWKLNRHSGVTIEVTPRQRRHPLIWGWPVIIRLIRGQILR